MGKADNTCSGGYVNVSVYVVLLALVREATSPLPSLAEWVKQDDAHSGGFEDVGVWMWVGGSVDGDVDVWMWMLMCMQHAAWVSPS